MGSGGQFSVEAQNIAQKSKYQGVSHKNENDHFKEFLLIIGLVGLIGLFTGCFSQIKDLKSENRNLRQKLSKNLKEINNHLGKDPFSQVLNHFKQG